MYAAQKPRGPRLLAAFALALIAMSSGCTAVMYDIAKGTGEGIARQVQSVSTAPKTTALRSDVTVAAQPASPSVSTVALKNNPFPGEADSILVDSIEREALSTAIANSTEARELDAQSGLIGARSTTPRYAPTASVDSHDVP